MRHLSVGCIHQDVKHKEVGTLLQYVSRPATDGCITVSYSLFMIDALLGGASANGLRHCLKAVRVAERATAYLNRAKEVKWLEHSAP